MNQSKSHQIYLAVRHVAELKDAEVQFSELRDAVNALTPNNDAKAELFARIDVLRTNLLGS